MWLTIPAKFLGARRTNGRYLLAPIAWVYAAMFALSHVAANGSPLTVFVNDPVAVDISDTPDPVVDEPDPAADSDADDPVADRPITDLEQGKLRPDEPMLRIVSRDAFYADLRTPLDLNVWGISTHRNDDPNAFYGGPWTRENILQYRDRLVLEVRPGVNGERPTMAEIYSRKKYGYGRYEAIMRPSGESGVVTAFFTYTGPWSGDPHDEVDIEFAGARPEQVEYNYWRNGRTGASSREPLGFNASEQMNLYAFEWSPDEIVWYVNGIEHYRSPRGSTRVPDQPGNIIISAWTGTPAMQAWMGPPEFGESAQAEFACISFTPIETDSYSCADLWGEDPQFSQNDEPVETD